MVVIPIKTYPYSRKASFFANLWILYIFALLVIAAILFASGVTQNANKTVMLIVFCVAVISCIVVAILGSKMGKKIAEAESDNNIKSKAFYARNYFTRHRTKEDFDWLCRVNPEFAQKYDLDESGRLPKLVKR